MKIRAAVLERTGGPLTVTELDLAEPGLGEVRVRLHASGVCHSDQNAIDGTAETRCPTVLGHEGAGVVEAVGPGGARMSSSTLSGPPVRSSTAALSLMRAPCPSPGGGAAPRRECGSS